MLKRKHEHKKKRRIHVVMLCYEGGVQNMVVVKESFHAQA